MCKESRIPSLRKQIVGMNAKRMWNIVDIETLVAHFSYDHVDQLMQTVEKFQIVIIDGVTQIPDKIAIELNRLMERYPGLQIRIMDKEIGPESFKGEWLIADDRVFIAGTGSNSKPKQSNGDTVDQYKFVFQSLWDLAISIS